MTSNIDAAWSFQRYQEIRHRLPAASFPGQAQRVSGLDELADHFDAVVFDAFGVLNVGESPIPSAISRVGELRRAGKKVRVLTNAASLTKSASVQKFDTLGYDFCAEEIISSRGVLIAALRERNLSGRWGCVAPADAPLDDLPVDACIFDPDDACDLAGVIFLVGAGWDDTQNDRLSACLNGASIPFLVGNPDLVAPRGDWFSVEPGSYAHVIADRDHATPEFFGKPFGNAFDAARASVGYEISPERILMVGDTLHTDILGGAAAGFRTCLVTDHGVLRELDVDACIAESGITPDYIAPTI